MIHQLPLDLEASRNGLARNILADPPTAPIAVWAVRRMLAGMHPISVATAAGVSIRTAYRWEIEHTKNRRGRLPGYARRVATTGR